MNVNFSVNDNNAVGLNTEEKIIFLGMLSITWWNGRKFLFRRSRIRLVGGATIVTLIVVGDPRGRPADRVPRDDVDRVRPSRPLVAGFQMRIERIATPQLAKEEERGDSPEDEVEGGHDGGELAGGVPGGEADGEDDDVEEHQHHVDSDRDDHWTWRPPVVDCPEDDDEEE